MIPYVFLWFFYGFLRVITDEQNSFALSLEKLAVKKLSNKEVLNCVKNVLEKKKLSLQTSRRELRNILNQKKGLLARYEALDTSLDKLRKEYANLKSE